MTQIITDQPETTDDDNEIGIRGLNAKQTAALPLLASGMSPKEAAAAVGVSWGTLRHWMSGNTAFKAAVQTLRRELHQNALAAVHALSADAVAALRDVLTDPMIPPRERISAASTVLRHVMPTQSNHRIVTEGDAASMIANILNSLESDDAQDHP